jgi:serine/threonine-protein kinase
MATVTVDGHGKLLAFSAVPTAEVPATPAGPEEVFRAAGLPMGNFQEVPPALTPAHASDSVRAWKGLHPVLPDTQVTIQIAAWKGRISEVAIAYPWMTGDESQRQPWVAKVRDVLMLAFPVCGVLLMSLVARRNWKQGRTDRRGALSIACARFVIGFVAWAGLVHAVPAGSMLDLIESAGAELLGSSLVLWALYLAIEPAVRSRYPHSIVTWNRLLAGRWLDAQVGGHILIGAAVGCAIWMGYQLLVDFGARDVIEVGGNLTSILGTRPWIGRQVVALGEALTSGLFVFAVICGLRRIARYDIVAAVLTAVIFTVTQEEIIGTPNWQVMAAIFVALYTVLAIVLMRIGLVATISAIFYVNLFSAITLGNDWKAWYAPAGLATITLMLGLAGFAFWRSLGSRDLLGGDESPA